MTFKKGNIPYNKGLKHSEEHKNKISLNNARYWKGKPKSEETKRKISNSEKGKKANEETIKKLRESHLGQVAWNKGLTKENDKRVRKYIDKMIITNKGRKRKPCSENTKIKIRKANIGKIRSIETKQKLKIARSKKILPVKDTSIEIIIQNFLKQLNIEFFTHQYIKEIEHGYQCDILIPSMNLVIECDGDYWHKYPIGRDIDKIRTSELLEHGFKVLRLWEHEIRKMNIEEFKDILLNN